MEHSENTNQTLIELDIPIERGEQSITHLTLRKPKAGELRGVNLLDLMQMNTNVLTKVLPRITQPSLTEADIGKLDPADLTACAIQVACFLVQKSAKTDASLVA